jgi:phosphatidylserine decarboxylase
MKVAKQGWKLVGIGAAFAAAGGALMTRPGYLIAGAIVVMLGLDFVAFCLYFFRDPERALPTDGSKIYSPGDGRVLSVSREGPGDVVTCRIFLSVFNVHIQRAPTAGTVEKVQSVPGSFRAAMKAEAVANERCVMTIKPSNGRGPLVVEQIAGYIARRIECWPKPGEILAAGQRYGIIYFGSQAAVHFPAGSKCTAQVGDIVTAGVTPIGEWI